jgi:RimJ/RimL family protein N-acetyltransferase
MEESDAPLVVEWRNRPDTREWLIQWEALTVETHLRWFRGRSEAGDLLVVFDTLDGEPVASTSLQDFDRPGTSAEWGRLCAARIGGNPHAILEGCYLLHRMCFEALGMFRVRGSVASDNQRAYRLYQFLGYQTEGLRRKHWVKPGGYSDVIEIGIFPEEFAAQRPALEEKLYGVEPPPEFDAAHLATLRERLELEQRGRR